MYISTYYVQRSSKYGLISKYGMSYKSARTEVLKQMVEAIIYEGDLLGIAMQCHELTKTYTIGFNTLVKKAKLAAGLCMFLHCLWITWL